METLSCPQHRVHALEEQTRVTESKPAVLVADPDRPDMVQLLMILKRAFQGLGFVSARHFILYHRLVASIKLERIERVEERRDAIWLRDC